MILGLSSGITFSRKGNVVGEYYFSIGGNRTECISIEVNEIHSALKICFNLTFPDSP